MNESSESSDPTGPIIRLEGVTKSYGEGPHSCVALRAVSLEIASGEFVTIMGQSAAGKTTLLNLMSGLDAPESGRVVVCGMDLGNLSDHQLADLRLHSIGFVFQAFNLLPALTVERNVSWPLQFSGHPPAEVARRAAEAMRLAGIDGREARYPGQLSGGEQQRVAIARAIATKPSILLVDEPTGNLDSITGRRILDLLRSLNRSQKVTIVMVTHNPFAGSYGDRTLVLQDGQFTSDAGYQAPAATTTR